MLALDFETPLNVKSSNYGNIYSGYFNPPATAQYRFYVSCDDGCQLSLGNGSSSFDPSSKQVIFSQTGATGYRSYFTVGNWRVTNWMTLQKGLYYYMEGLHYQVSGADHMTVSVEISDPNI